jgi:hypothetical protein
MRCLCRPHLPDLASRFDELADELSSQGELKNELSIVNPFET